MFECHCKPISSDNLTTRHLFPFPDIKCKAWRAVANNMLPRLHLLYIFPFRNLLREPAAMTLDSDKTNGTPEPSINLPKEEKILHSI